MTAKERIISLWNDGKNTAEIAKILTDTTSNNWAEWRVHTIIIQERAARLGLTTINGNGRQYESQRI